MASTIRHTPKSAARRAVAAGAGRQAVACVEGDQGQRGGGCRRDQRLRIAVLPGRIDDREPVARAREVPVGDADEQILRRRIGQGPLLRAL